MPQLEAMRVTQELVSSLLPRRKRAAHKGDFGKILVCGGSVGFTGAPVLASLGALRTGAGMVFLSTPEEVYPIVAGKCLEAMPSPLPAGGEAKSLRLALAGKDAVLIGPGLGRSQRTQALTHLAMQEAQCPLVLDADGLNALSSHIDWLEERRGRVTVLTPHEGEFARLGGGLSSGRQAAARDFAQKHACFLVLKGHETITATPSGDLFLNTTGNPGMATGGSGDVLAGMLLSLLGQGLAPAQAALAAVWLHGRAGDLAAADMGEYSILPSDLIDRIPAAIRGNQELLTQT